MNAGPSEPANHEMAIARRIQRGFLPSRLPQPPSWEIAAYFQPARDVGGDFYDVFSLNREQRFGFVVADVCGKGVGAALFMALIRSLVRAFARQHHGVRWTDYLGERPGAAARAFGPKRLPSAGEAALHNAVVMTNEYIVENHGESGMFATLFFGVLDPAAGDVHYVNAGHNPPWIVRRGGVRERLAPTGPSIGLSADATFAVKTARLDPGDALFAFTDGLPEAQSGDGELFSEARLAQALAQACAGPATPSARELIERVMTEVAAHIGAADPFDDMTILAIRRSAATSQEGGTPTC